MLEVLKKRMVKTRKEHKCYGCCDEIATGEQAIYVRGKEDDKHVNFHLHVDCHIKAMKRDFFAEGFEKGCLANKEVLEDFTIENTAYPF